MITKKYNIFSTSLTKQSDKLHMIKTSNLITTSDSEVEYESFHAYIHVNM